MVYQPLTIFCDVCDKELTNQEIESWKENTEFLNKMFPNPNSFNNTGGFTFGSNSSHVLRPYFIDGECNNINKRNCSPENYKPVKWENNFFKEYCFKCVLKEFHGIPYNHEPHIEKGNVYYFHLCNDCFENERFKLLFPYQHNLLKTLENKIKQLEHFKTFGK